MPSLGLTPAALSSSACSANTAGKKARTAWPKMIGSETFIIVAFRCTENRTPCALGVGDLLGQEPSQRRAPHHGRVEHLAGEHGASAP